MMRLDEKPIETLSFRILGEAVPEGSVRSFYVPKAHKTVTKHQNESELRAWRIRVALEAQSALKDQPWTMDGTSAYTIHVNFIIPRPASVASHKRLHPIVKPDLDKLIRAIDDALTGILFNDDCQIVSVICSKDYNDEMRAGAYINVSRYANAFDRPRKKKDEGEGINE